MVMLSPESEMKNSGIDYIGDIPKLWSIIKLCYVSERIFLGKTPQYATKENENLTLGQKNNQLYGLDLKGIKYSTDEHFKSSKPEDFVIYGDILLNSLGTGSVGRIGYFDIKNRKFLTDGHIIVIRPNDEIDNKYLFYYLRTLRNKFEDDAVGSTNQAFLTVSKIYKTIVPYPSNWEQKAIGDYLDGRCSRIDEIIAEATASIEEYKELRIAEITRCVTNGVRKHSDLKDSGDSWVGYIPSSWELCKVKNIASYVSDGAHVSPETDNGVYAFISTANLKNGVLDFENCLVTSEDSYIQLVRNGCQPQKNDVLISKDGTVGKTAVIDYVRDFVVASSLVIIRPRLEVINPYYLQYNLQSNFVQQKLQLLMHGAGLKRVSVAKNSNLPVVLPPLEEQAEIVKHLDRRISDIDTLISEKQALIDDLQAYKKSLIYEVVTGKRRVV